MKKEIFVIMFLTGLAPLGCQSPSVSVSDKSVGAPQSTTTSKPRLLRASDQTDSSQGNAVLGEPNEKNPTGSNISARPWMLDRRRRLNSETAPASEPSSQF